MTPAEHYAEAERLVADDEYGDPPTQTELAQAQVHATLATYTTLVKRYVGGGA